MILRLHRPLEHFLDFQIIRTTQNYFFSTPGCGGAFGTGQGRSLRRGNVEPTEYFFQGLFQGGFHGNFVFVTDNDAFEFRDFSGIRFQVQGPHIDQGFFNGNDQQIPLNDLGAALVPQGNLPGNISILIESGHHLGGSVNQFLFGKSVNHQFAVLLTIAPCHHPC